LKSGCSCEYTAEQLRSMIEYGGIV
jgi:hypothetical protein